MRVALDTDRCTDPLRGDAGLVEHLGGRDEVCIPLIVLVESGSLAAPNSAGMKYRSTNSVPAIPVMP